MTELSCRGCSPAAGPAASTRTWWCFLTGLVGRFTDNVVPEALGRTDVLVAAGILTAVDFVADKIAYVDSTWDAVNTVIRPAPAPVIALLISGDATTLEQAVYATTGGVTAFASHAAKMGTRWP